jgi:hypothetical protein
MTVVDDPIDRLRAVARTALAVGAVGSLAMMIHAGRHNRSIALILLFTGWVSSPFIALAVLDRWATRWSPTPRAMFYRIMAAAAAASLSVYVFDAFRPRPQAAFFYVLVPPATWAIGGVVLALATAVSRRSRIR